MDGSRDSSENKEAKMNGLISAIQFITILPVGKPGQFDPEKMAQYFPLTGIILGVFVSMADQIFLKLWSVQVASILDAALFALLTGAFHIDGLGDAADGLLGHRKKDEALDIMKDSRIGAMGLVVIFCVLLIKTGGIMDLDSYRSLIIIIIPAYSRSSMLFAIKYLNYGRRFGTGHALFNEKPGYISFWGLLIPVALSVFLGWEAILLNIFFFIITAGIIAYYKKRIGSITGDMLGAMTEVVEAALFLTVSAGSAI